MNRERFVMLAVIAFGIVGLSFVVRGVSRLFVGSERAQLVSAPIAVLGFLLLVYLFVRASLDAIGLWNVE